MALTGGVQAARATDLHRMWFKKSLVLGVDQTLGHVPRHPGESSRLIGYADSRSQFGLRVSIAQNTRTKCVRKVFNEMT